MEAGTVWALYKYVLYYPVNSLTLATTNDGKAFRQPSIVFLEISSLPESSLLPDSVELPSTLWDDSCLLLPEISNNQLKGE